MYKHMHPENACGTLLQEIARHPRCLACGLLVCGCVYVTGATIAAAKGEEMEDHKIAIGFVNFATQVSGTASITTASINLVSWPSLDGIVGDAITEGEYGLKPYLPAPTNEPRPADGGYLSVQRRIAFYDQAGKPVTVRFGWEAPKRE
jgi:hypothetical protein